MGLVAASISRTQLFEREGPAGRLPTVRELFTEQIRLLKEAGVDFLILETFFRLDEMLIVLECGMDSGLPCVATLSFRPVITQTIDGVSPADCARRLVDGGACVVGGNCEQEPQRYAQRFCVRCEPQWMCPSQLSRLHSRLRTNCPRSCACRSFRMIWRPFRCRGSHFTILVCRLATKEFSMWAVAVAATPPTFASWLMDWRMRRSDGRTPMNIQVFETASLATTAATDWRSPRLTHPETRNVMVAGGNTPLSLYGRWLSETPT